MTLPVFGLILLSIALSALAQVVLKLGMSAAGVSRALADGGAAHVAWAVASEWRVLAGLALYLASAAAWLFVLARLQVSAAYPFVGLGFVLTLLLGWWWLGDTLSAERVLGTLLVAAGVVLIARS
ncbi:MAG: EamA family transporter [Rubrivivax sp.]|nr:EamA family transporter [Rubrivivax sp.]